MALTEKDMIRLAEIIEKNHKFNMGNRKSPRIVGQVNLIGSTRKVLIEILPDLNELLGEKKG